MELIPLNMGRLPGVHVFAALPDWGQYVHPVPTRAELKAKVVQEHGNATFVRREITRHTQNPHLIHLSGRQR